MARGDKARLPTRYREVPKRSASRASGLDAEQAMEQRLGAMFRAVAEPQPLSAAELAEVRFRLAQRSPASRAFVRFREWGLVLAFVLLGASVASAGVGLLQLFSEPRAETSSNSESMRVVQGPERARPPATRLSPLPSASSAFALEVAPEPEQVTDARQSRARSGFEIEADDAAISDKKQAEQRALTLESIALGRALTKLRRERDPNAALLLFDQYAAEFPNGALRLESRVARIDALLALGRKSEALSELAELPLQRVARGSELRLLRAELWAERDCQRALADFQALLDGSTSGSVAERALHGRAVCRLHLGDRARAASDLRAYLQRYPAGVFASEVRASLASGNLESAAPSAP
jgi:hypothetical protein